MSSEIVKYKLDNGDEMELTQEKVIQHMISGNSRGVTPTEILTFMQLCKAHRLNPFLKEAYLVKYGDSPATIITGKDAFTKRAQANPRFRGMEAGVTVNNNGTMHRRDGSMVLPEEVLLGGWCKVYVEGYEKPMFDEVSLSEYSTGKSNWKRMPATMIRKVAIVHALREAFPDDLGGLYDSSEMGAQGESQIPVDAPTEELEVVAEAPVVDSPAPEEVDMKKTLWNELATVKAQAEGMGITAEGMISWANAHIVNPDGTPKPMNLYTAEEIAAFRDHIAGLVADMVAIEQANETPNETAYEQTYEEDYQSILSENDIEF